MLRFAVCYRRLLKLEHAERVRGRRKEKKGEKREGHARDRKKEGAEMYTKRRE